MTVITQENTGLVGLNLNKLLKRAKGEYVAIISCDDMFIEDSFKEKIIDLEEDNNLAFVCHSKILTIDENNAFSDKTILLKLDEYENPSVNDILELEYYEIGAYFEQGGIFRASIAEKVGYFDEDMICDDIVFRTKLARYLREHKELYFKVLHTPGVYYRLHGSNISSNSLRQIKGVTQYLRRYWSEREPPEKLFLWIDGAMRNAKIKKELKSFLLNDNDALYVFGNSESKLKNIFKKHNLLHLSIERVKHLVKKIFFHQVLITSIT